MSRKHNIWNNIIYEHGKTMNEKHGAEKKKRVPQKAVRHSHQREVIQNTEHDVGRQKKCSADDLMMIWICCLCVCVWLYGIAG